MATHPPVDFSETSPSNFVAAVQGLYGLRAGEGPNTATPHRVLPLLDFLDTIMAAAMARHRSTNVLFRVPSFEPEFAKVEERMNRYRKITEKAIKDGKGKEFSQPYGREVLLPLLMGIFPDGGPQRPADMASPYSLMHQADASSASADIAWKRFGTDLASRAQTFAGPAGGLIAGITGNDIQWGKMALWVGGGLLVVGGIVGLRSYWKGRGQAA